MNSGAAEGLKRGDHLYLIDGSGYLFRAYHALPPLSRKSDGLPVGAVHGFCQMLHKLLEDMKQGERPTHLAVIFDAGKETFRNAIFPAYKANRPEPPEDLIPQFPLVREATRAFGVACVEMANFEADDLIATYARAAAAAGARVTIISSDKDLMQLVEDGRIELLDTMKNRRLGRADVIEKFGVPPDKVVEVQALSGDSVDNVPGVPGIGIKTAAQLIGEYGDLETLLARAGEIKQPKRRENLINHAEAARVSHALVTLKDDVPDVEPAAGFAVHEPDGPTLIAFLKAMEFTSLTRRVAAAHEVEAAQIEAATALAADAPETDAVAATGTQGQSGAGRPGAVKDRTAVLAPIDRSAYTIITDARVLARWIDAAFEAGHLAVDTETSSLDPMQAELVGISLALAPGRAAYVPLGHRAGGGTLGLDGETPVQIAREAAIAALKPLLEDPAVLKTGQNIKFDMAVFAQAGINLAPVDDTMLMSYVLDCGRGGHGMDELSERHLGHKPISFAELCGTGKAQIPIAEVPLARAAEYAAEDADVTLRLAALLKPRLAAEKKVTVYETLERPLIPVIAAMERAGVLVDRARLSQLSGTFAQKMAALEAEIHEMAGESFNVGSPKQLGEILFEKLGLSAGRRTRTGAFSTDADTLEELAAEGHDLPRRVLDWRQLQKLRGTYTDALPNYINPHTGRVHTSYSLAATTTGRLSSSEPNLQNIPIRTEEGRQIRTAFVAPEGMCLISADYSQIELRLLAHIAGIDALRQAFADGIDIHAMTASEMFGVPVEGMDPMVRRRAKAINFGIIYGISAYGLSNQLSIPQSEAADYIKRYFERFPGIRDYMDRTKRTAREKGFVETVFGRRLWTPGVGAKGAGERAFAERAAINAPIQGSAADIIRRAMIAIPASLAGARLSARMLMQVHDELVFECPAEEAGETKALVARVMEEAALPVLDLSVPLVVEAKDGANWDEAH